MSKIVTYFFILTSLWSINILGQNVHIHNENLPCLDKHFNVAVHISLDKEGNGNISMESIQELFKSVQPFFEPICLSFSLCQIDTIKNYSFDTIGINRAEKLAEHFNLDYMLNLYLVSKFETFASCHVGNYNGIQEPSSAFMFLPKYCDGDAFAHVIGHVLGLLDTSEGDGIELVDGSNCETHGDLICDTPADPYDFTDNKIWLNDDCIFVNISDTDANGEFYNPQVSNIMSHYFNCRSGFSSDQFRYMVKNCESIDFDLW